MRLGRSFWRAVGEVVRSNAAMDFLSSTRSDPVYHFDSERVESAVELLRQFWTHTLLSIRAKEYQSARRSLGQLFHSLQVRIHSTGNIRCPLQVKFNLKELHRLCHHRTSTATVTGWRWVNNPYTSTSCSQRSPPSLWLKVSFTSVKSLSHQETTAVTLGMSDIIDPILAYYICKSRYRFLLRQ